MRVEPRHDLAGAGRAAVGQHRRGGPAGGWAQQAAGEAVGRVDPLEEASVLGAGKLACEPGVDDGVERDVVGDREARVEAGVREDHVPQLVHHEQEQVLVPRAVLGDEVGVDEQARMAAALDRRRLDLPALDDAREPAERLHLEARGREAGDEPLLQPAADPVAEAHRGLLTVDASATRRGSSLASLRASTDGSRSRGAHGSSSPARVRPSTLSASSGSAPSTRRLAHRRPAPGAGTRAGPRAGPPPASAARAARAGKGRRGASAAASGATAKRASALADDGDGRRHRRPRPHRHVVQQSPSAGSSARVHVSHVLHAEARQVVAEPAERRLPVAALPQVGVAAEDEVALQGAHLVAGRGEVAGEDAPLVELAAGVDLRGRHAWLEHPAGELHQGLPRGGSQLPGCAEAQEHGGREPDPPRLGRLRPERLRDEARQVSVGKPGPVGEQHPLDRVGLLQHPAPDVVGREAADLPRLPVRGPHGERRDRGLLGGLRQRGEQRAFHARLHLLGVVAQFDPRGVDHDRVAPQDRRRDVGSGARRPRAAGRRPRRPSPPPARPGSAPADSHARRTG